MPVENVSFSCHFLLLSTLKGKLSSVRTKRILKCLLSSCCWLQAWKLFGKRNIEDIQARGGRGDFIATVTRDDIKDLKLRSVLAKWLDQMDDEFKHEAITLTNMRGNKLPTMQDIVDTSHFWMSDHTRFWYHLEANQPIFNLGGVLISDTGVY